nr:ABC transporter ATP-binding protein [Corynebacterium aquatimens]
MAISAEHLTVGYGRTTIIDDMTFGPLEEGKVVGLIGPNAAGKSTLVKTIAGIKKPSQGTCSIVVDGREVTGKSRTTAIGYVPQDMLTTASLTAFESIMVSAKRAARPISIQSRQLRTSWSGSTSRTSPTAWSPTCPAASASWSASRRCSCAARAFCFSTNLRPPSTCATRCTCSTSSATKWRGPRLALVAIHDLNLAARFCDELLVVKAGRVVALDTPAAVLNPELLNEVYGINARVLDDAGVPVICPV